MPPPGVTKEATENAPAMPPSFLHPRRNRGHFPRSAIARPQDLAEPPDHGFRFVANAAFPDDDHAPALPLQGTPVPGVPLDVPLEFLLPEVRARRRRSRVPAPAMTMPETSMHEDHGTMLGQHDIRRAGQPPIVQPEPEACTVESASNYPFGPGILPADRRHHAGSRVGIDNIRHHPPVLPARRAIRLHAQGAFTIIMKRINVVDIFAGPGGLGEGFAAFSPKGAGGKHPFHIAFSAEKDPAAVSTLRLRTFLRLCMEAGHVPASYYQYLRDPDHPPYDETTESLWTKAVEETKPLELGTSAGSRRLRHALEAKIGNDRDWVLIGGPPCQAYSLMGRSRNRGIRGYRPEKDKRHFLYRHYLRILAEFRPAAFVMENVKGILSSRVGNELIFPQILRDLAEPNGTGSTRSRIRYRIHSLVTDEVFHPGDDPAGLDAANFIVRSENYGIPQSRHRVILIGIRDDGLTPLDPSTLSLSRVQAPVNWALNTLPPLRSGLSKGDVDVQTWRAEIFRALREARHAGLDRCQASEMRAALEDYAPELEPHDRGGRFVNKRTIRPVSAAGERALLRVFRTSRLRGYPNHETRGHMPMDLVRYLFATTFAAMQNRSPRSSEFPEALAPAHRNWNTGHFADRFRVQVSDAPASTITSHISKDGHYYIHPDPTQCRSLTVREAARLQTFPDDYLFEGNRTQQYAQVGNAVPPLLARKIAKIIYDAIS